MRSSALPRSRATRSPSKTRSRTTTRAAISSPSSSSDNGFGTLIVEPAGSTYHDPKTGKPIRSGPIADIHTVEPVGYGVNGSFRELMVQVHDTVPHTVNIVTA